MIAILLVLHILVAVFLVVSILLQSGQAGGLSGALGGGGSQTLFGGRGAATFLSRATTYLGAAFLLVSLLLAFAQSHRTGGPAEGRNVVRDAFQQSEQAPAEQPSETPEAPGTPGGLEAPSAEPAPAGAGGQ